MTRLVFNRKININLTVTIHKSNYKLEQIKTILRVNKLHDIKTNDQYFEIFEMKTNISKGGNIELLALLK